MQPAAHVHAKRRQTDPCQCTCHSWAMTMLSPAATSTLRPPQSNTYTCHSASELPRRVVSKHQSPDQRTFPRRSTRRASSKRRILGLSNSLHVFPRHLSGRRAGAGGCAIQAYSPSTANECRRIVGGRLMRTTRRPGFSTRRCRPSSAALSLRLVLRRQFGVSLLASRVDCLLLPLACLLPAAVALALGPPHMPVDARTHGLGGWH